MRFRIYYGDGSTFEGAPELAPSENVQCIAWDDPEQGVNGAGRIVLYNWDIYIFSDDIGWHGTNKYFDLMTHLGKGCGPGGVRAVLSGGWIARQAFLDIRERAMTDPPFMAKSASIPNLEDGTE